MRRAGLPGRGKGRKVPGTVLLDLHSSGRPLQGALLGSKKRRQGGTRDGSF